MTNRTHTFLILAVVLALVGGACALPGLSASPQDSGARVGTAAAATAQSILTQQVIETVIAYLTTTPPAPVVEAQSPPTATLAASSTPFIPTPSITQVPTQPSSTPIPTIAGGGDLCNMARFVSDVTVSDGARYQPGASFTKVWRLKNVGTCIWTADYTLAFDRGDRMDGAATPINQNVLPGQTVDVSVKLTAPNAPGEYTGYWLLHTDMGVPFGVGPTAAKAFYVQIVVPGSGSKAGVLTDLTSSYCSAEWKGGDGALPCPSTESEAGAVWRAGSPRLEGGVQDDEPALVMAPSAGSSGYIEGRFAAFKVGDNSHFKAVIGCMDSSPNCDVTMKLSYAVEGGAPQNLGSWQQVSDNDFKTVDVSLSSLAGKNVQLILRVENNGDSDDDRAFWLVPRITK